jgi:hypothetical protein
MEDVDDINPILWEPAATGYLPAVLYNYLGWRGEQMHAAQREPRRARAWLEHYAGSENRSARVWEGFESGGWPPGADPS